MKTLGLIPVRGGSKGISGKNLYPVRQKPLIAYTIEAARKSAYIDPLIVSTDDEEIARKSREWGALVPFMRPGSLAEDHSSALDVVNHAVDYYLEQGVVFDYIVYLQPTSPLRTSQSIDQSIELMQNHDADSLVSVVEVPHQFGMDSQMVEQNGLVKPALGNALGKLRRQDKPRYVARNGPAILITRPATLVNHGSLYGEKILSFLMNDIESLDIDRPDDLWLFEQRLLQS